MAEDRVLDRLVNFDDKSKEYPIRALLDDKPVWSRTHQFIQLDQGREGACVGFSCTMEAAARPRPWFGDPIFKRATFTPERIQSLNATARNHYYRCQAIDPFPPGTEGTDVLSGMKIGQENGYWTEYRWALGPGAEAAADDVIRTVSQKGPVVMGTYWYGGMYRANSDGFLTVTGSPVGGHAYLLTRYNRYLDAVWTPNSWGGQGQGWISRADLTRLLDEDGEAAIPVVRLVAED